MTRPAYNHSLHTVDTHGSGCFLHQFILYLRMHFCEMNDLELELESHKVAMRRVAMKKKLCHVCASNLFILKIYIGVCLQPHDFIILPVHSELQKTISPMTFVTWDLKVWYNVYFDHWYIACNSVYLQLLDDFKFLTTQIRNLYVIILVT